MGKNQAIYYIQRYVETNEGKEMFGDGSHIIYVNGQDEKKVAAMCKIMEDMENEAAQKAELKSAKETAERLIKKGKMTLEVRSVSPCSLRVTASEHIGTEIYMLFLPLRRNMGD